MTPRIYLERGRLVQLLTRWAPPGPAPTPPAWLTWWWRPAKRAAPRNVLIQRRDGTRVVRPFRGLRRPGGEH